MYVCVCMYTQEEEEEGDLCGINDVHTANYYCYYYYFGGLLLTNKDSYLLLFLQKSWWAS